CTIGVTETAKIQGISAAGENPEITDYTPPADVELLHLGKCKCISGVPVTPDGIPTPALITMSALKLADIPSVVISAGLKIKPNVPFIELGGKPGRDIRTGNAVENSEEVLNRAKIVGDNLSKTVDYLVIGESIPGGTTTTLSVLMAMGFNAEGKVSSSMPNNPHKLKIRTAKEGIKAAGIKVGDLRKDPLKAISTVGDPMQPALAGLVLGAANKVPVILAGGTQMAAVLAIANELDSKVKDNLAIGTTRWIVNDRNSNLIDLVNQIVDIPIFAANLNFTKSELEGLKAYEKGIVKEGVGCGGATISAMLKYEKTITKDKMLRQIEINYNHLVNSGK
ncbi:MAG: TIGR00303 family protein, partial [Candidatus Bathyarchaeota archaeon]